MGATFVDWAFFFGFLFLLFSFVWFWGGEALLRNMRAARPLTIALSWILAVFGGGLVGLTLVAEFTFANAMPLPIVFGSALESLLLLALGIYGFVVARRILSPPHGGAQVNR